jgi:hypothetical protein
LAAGTRRVTMHLRHLASIAAVAVLVPAATADAAPFKSLSPRPEAPAGAATVQALPSFTWKALKGADRYQFQLAGDRRFGSIVVGTGRGKGSFETRNTAATVDKTIPDGRYFWRVRGISAGGRASKWSATRTLIKAWSVAPRLETPVEGATVSWPSDPLVLRWSPVDHATRYLVSIATDSGLSNLVVGDASKPPETQGTVFALGSALAAGEYYWAVTPLDAEGHRGTPSRTAKFRWTWPSTVRQLGVTDLNGTAEVFDPQLSWAPVSGAARYQVEISTASGFPSGSVVCCSEPTTGTSLSPSKVLANNTGSGNEPFGYLWRVRAIDPEGDAGAWSYGPGFDETYPAQVGRLHLRDNLGDAPADADPSTGVVDTSAPAIVWDQVPGASSYEVHVVPYVQVPSTSTFVCNWSSSSSDTWDVITAATAWTPLGSPGTHRPTGVLSDLTPATDGAHQPKDGASYCVRVRARRDRDAKTKEVVSDWTTIAGGNAAAFRFVAPATSGSTLTASAGDYLEPGSGSQHPWMPLFTWKPLDGARGYFVVVARDAQFTKIVDVAFTNVPVYAPRRGVNPWTYPDETTSYWWAVVPTALANGDIAPTPPTGNSPRTFTKSSTPTQPISPAGGQVVAQQPAFHWTPTLGARSYTLQVAQDPSFGEPIATIQTDSTGYTSSATFPADSALWWRVRANDEIGTGLNWSSPQTFNRTLPPPTPVPGNPRVGSVIPELSWNAVEGAVSYDVHVDQPDGTKKDFTVGSTSFTPTKHYGTGTWSWKVRANFPTIGTQTVSGGYFPPLDFLRRLVPPAGAKGVRTSSRTLVTWNPDPSATEYRVEIADNDSFTKLIEWAKTQNTSWAPDLTKTAYRRGGRIYWRVAVVDSGDNVGAYVSGSFTLPRAPGITTAGTLRRGHRGTFTVRVKTTAGQALRKAKVTVSGAGVSRVTQRTGKKGTATFRVRPRRKGSVAVRVQARGYKTTTVKMPVR